MFKQLLNISSLGITRLVTFVGFIGIWLSSKGQLDWKTTLACLLGLALASAGASVFNNLYDRDIDGLMPRTQNRPLVTQAIQPWQAYLYATFISLLSLLILWTWVNPLTTFLTLIGFLSYALVYTVWLKRNTSWAIELGGISGAMPPLIGWAAVQNQLPLEAWILFAILFFWQPPHFWALAVRYKKDYQKAHIPILPLVKSEKTTWDRSLLFVILLIASSLAVYGIQMAGKIYLITALLLGITYIILNIKALTNTSTMGRTMFLYSIFYLPVLFIAMIFNPIN